MNVKRALGIAIAIGLVACGSRSEMTVALPQRDAGAISLPTPVALASAIVVEMRADPSHNALERLDRAPRVAAVSRAEVVTKPVRAGKKSASLRTVVVDPVTFRSFAPAPTRDADFVWTSLLAGKAVLTSRAVDALSFEDPGSIAIGSATYEVGAFADNGTPNVADVMVTARPAGKGRVLVFVGMRRGSTDEAARLAHTHLAGIARVRPLTPSPEPPRQVTPAAPIGRTEGDLIGEMTFRILKSGYIEPDPAWVRANIASGTVPILGRVTCHRLLFPQLAAALAEIEEAGLARSIDPSDYGGCYVPRFIDRDPRRGLSFHAFGLAVDLNVSENYLGTRGKMDPKVVAIFEKWGFEWGGRWSRPDPMHFQLARLIRT